MSDRIEEFGPGVDVALVMFTSAAEVRSYAMDHALAIPVLRDPDRAAYRAFGIGRGSFRRVWGLRAARRYAEIARTDRLRGLRRPTEDTLQLGADIVIAPDGVLRWAHWGEGPDDRPDLDELIRAARTS